MVIQKIVIFLQISKYLSLLAVSAHLILPIKAFAQDAKGGYSRIQGVDKEPEKKEGLFVDGLTIDFREEMRMFVQNISKYARSHRPNFTIIAGGGLELLVKRNEINRSQVSPARTYIRSLDGVMQRGLFHDEKTKDSPFGSKTDIFKQEKMLALAKTAKESGLRVFVLDFSKKKSIIDEIEKLSNERDYISTVVDAPFINIQRLPTYPTPPFRENSKSILSLNMVKNFATITNSAPFGHQDSFTLKMHETNHDMIVVDILHGRRPLTRQAVETLKFKKIGTRRLAIAYMDIGSAVSYHYYWKPGSRTGSPPWVSEAERDDPDRYKVEYWRPEWQEIITGSTNSYIYGLIAQGFDGVILNGLGAYKFFESDS